MFGCWLNGYDSDNYGYGYNSWSGPDRRNWAEKSSAALEREQEAKAIFHNRFLSQAKKVTDFPFTITGLIHPTMHLTDPCWRDFKKEVVKHGCTTKRRVVNPHERPSLTKSDPKAKVRKGKMYWIDVTIASSPEQALKDLEEKKKNAEEAKRRKEEKAKKLAEKRRLKMEEEMKKEREIKALVEKEYQYVVKAVHGDTDPVQDSPKKRSLEEIAGPEQAKVVDKSSSPTKKLKMSSTEDVKITAPISRLLSHANKIHTDKILQIRKQIITEKNKEAKKLMEELDRRMEAKEDQRKKEAEGYLEAIKKVIEGSESSKTKSTAKVTKSDDGSARASENGASKIPSTSIPQ